jgi:hypothetical protein
VAIWKSKPERIREAMVADMSAWAKVPNEVRLDAVRQFLKSEYPNDFPNYNPIVVAMVEWQVREQIDDLTKEGKTMPVLAVALIAVSRLNHITRERGHEAVWKDFLEANP